MTFRILTIRLIAIGVIALLMRCNGVSYAQEKVWKTYPKILIVQKGFLSAKDPAVKAFANELGIKIIAEQSENPICCVWIGSLDVDEKLSGPQFFLLHYGYTLIEVSSTRALRDLTDRIRREGTVAKGKMLTGVLTSNENNTGQP